ncbi:hypothetical protein IQ268_16135 [Oculatella sp. LEGE 06141]|uniref:hypothetical protein n=1 Tax=Oculatella sp. LEGE 06141 TaxID=1828648 RepID=UPI00187F8DF2|nr:hypothetical protein [Oculatella sp. LEGE 06141]MBE9180101.1 hypothetical protein [Oculatella sp. LEGE 06141]
MRAYYVDRSIVCVPTCATALPAPDELQRSLVYAKLAANHATNLPDFYLKSRCSDG